MTIKGWINEHKLLTRFKDFMQTKREKNIASDYKAWALVRDHVLKGGSIGNNCSSWANYFWKEHWRLSLNSFMFQLKKQLEHNRISPAYKFCLRVKLSEIHQINRCGNRFSHIVIKNSKLSITTSMYEGERLKNLKTKKFCQL